MQHKNLKLRLRIPKLKIPNLEVKTLQLGLNVHCEDRAPRLSGANCAQNRKPERLALRLMTAIGDCDGHHEGNQKRGDCDRLKLWGLGRSHGRCEPLRL